MTPEDKGSGAMGMLKKVLIGIVGLVVIVAFIGWKTAVAVHDRKSTSGNEGNLSTALDLLANFVPNRGKQAKAAFTKGDYETARKLYQPLADRGNQAAMLHLAVMNAKGQGGPVDQTQAVKWFRLLADQGDREAEFGLGLAYQNGKGVQQDYAETSRWYQKSAQQGSPAARVNLGVLYVNGQGVAPDSHRSARVVHPERSKGGKEPRCPGRQADCGAECGREETCC